MRLGERYGEIEYSGGKVIQQWRASSGNVRLSHLLMSSLVLVSGGGRVVGRARNSLPRDDMQARPMSSTRRVVSVCPSVCLSLCLSVTFANSVRTNKHIFKIVSKF